MDNRYIFTFELEKMKRYERLFFRDEKANPLDLILYATENYLVHHPFMTEFTIAKYKEWWVLHSKFDWVHVPSYSIEDMFQTIVNIRNVPSGYKRAELLVNVFCTTFFTALDSTIQLERVTEEAEVQEIINKYPEGRILAFQM